MSLTLSITTPEGIILAADSRQTYRNMVGASRVGSDSATKIFKVSERIGLTVAGPAFLLDSKKPEEGARGIGTYINDFLEQLNMTETVQTVAKKLHKHLESIYEPSKKLSEIEEQIKQNIKAMGGEVKSTQQSPNKDAVIIEFTDNKGQIQTVGGNIMPIALILAGYDEERVGKPELSVYNAYVPGSVKLVREHNSQNSYGANWTGQTDVITRVVLGRDPRLDQLESLQAAKAALGDQKVLNDLMGLEYIINWGTMTLLDAVDFAKLMIETTSAIQRFSDGIQMMPGDMPGVGGPIDVGVIFPVEGFKWSERKKLTLENTETLK